jgi:hypothetical protein
MLKRKFGDALAISKYKGPSNYQHSSMTDVGQSLTKIATGADPRAAPGIPAEADQHRRALNTHHMCQNDHRNEL